MRIGGPGPRMKFDGANGEEMSVHGVPFVFGVENAVVFAEFGGGGS